MAMLEIQIHIGHIFLHLDVRNKEYKNHFEVIFILPYLFDQYTLNVIPNPSLGHQQTQTISI